MLVDDNGESGNLRSCRAPSSKLEVLHGYLFHPKSSVSHVNEFMSIKSEITMKGRVLGCMQKQSGSLAAAK